MTQLAVKRILFGTIGLALVFAYLACVFHVKAFVDASDPRVGSEGFNVAFVMFFIQSGVSFLTIWFLTTRDVFKDIGNYVWCVNATIRATILVVPVVVAVALRDYPVCAIYGTVLFALGQVFLFASLWNIVRVPDNYTNVFTPVDFVINNSTGVAALRTATRVKWLDEYGREVGPRFAKVFTSDFRYFIAAYFAICHGYYVRDTVFE